MNQSSLLLHRMLRLVQLVLLLWVDAGCASQSATGSISPQEHDISNVKERSSCCQNGGMCILGSFCHCRKFYHGRHCQYKVAERACGAVQHGRWLNLPCHHCYCADGLMICLPSNNPGCDNSTDESSSWIDFRQKRRHHQQHKQRNYVVQPLTTRGPEPQMLEIPRRQDGARVDELRRLIQKYSPHNTAAVSCAHSSYPTVIIILILWKIICHL